MGAVGESICLENISGFRSFFFDFFLSIIYNKIESDESGNLKKYIRYFPVEMLI